MSDLIPKRLRARLTFWHGLMLVGVLLVYIVIVSFFSIVQMRTVLRRLAAEDMETVKGLLFWVDNVRVGLREDYHHHSDWKQVQERLLEVLSTNGQILYRNELLGDRSLDGKILPGEGIASYSERRAKLSDGTPVIVFSRTYELQGRPVIIREAYNEGLIWSEWWSTLFILLLGLPFALAAAVYTAYQMTGRALDPIDQMASRAEQINSERLNERLPVQNEKDELGHLANVFNAMLSRIEQSFDNLERFTSDASHELRTPLAAIRSIGEVALQREAPADEYREIIGSMLEELNRLTTMIDSLLILARADAGEIPMRKSVWPAMEVIREVASLLEILIEDKKLNLDLCGDETLCIDADRMYIRQAVLNILHNAVKFTPPGGSICVCVKSQIANRTPVAMLTFTDTGPGIPEVHRKLIFERFYRSSPGRSSDVKGAGLGLSIVKWAVEANGGHLELAENPEGGSIFSIYLPTTVNSAVHPR